MTVHRILGINRIGTLVYNNMALGLRVYSDEGVFDIERDILYANRVFNLRTAKELELVEIEGLLSTKEEADGKLEVQDISSNVELVERVIAELQSSTRTTQSGKPLFEVARVLFEVPAPHNMTLREFLADERWLPIRHQRNDEYNGQHSLQLPDKRMWRGGWIGKGRSFTEVKRNFHEKEVEYALFRGNIVPERVLDDYLHLKVIANKVQYITHKIFGIIYNPKWGYIISVNDTNYKLGEFLKAPRYEQRRIVRDTELLGAFSDLTPIKPTTYISDEEVVIMGVIRRCRRYAIENGLPWNMHNQEMY